MKMQRFAATSTVLLSVSWLTARAAGTETGDSPQALVDEYFFQSAAPVAVAGFQTLGGDWKVNDGIVTVGSRSTGPDRRDLCHDADTGRPSEWFAKDFLGVYNRRCAECHGKLEGTTDWTGRFAWINFSNPALSPALTAHLSKDQGGRGISTSIDSGEALLFASTDNPDYRTMLEAIEAGKRLSLELPRADMAGFANARPEP